MSLTIPLSITLNVFVFGSNTRGIPAGGAARTAHMQYESPYGHTSGQRGFAYAIPTMDWSDPRDPHPLGLVDIEQHVRVFQKHAAKPFNRRFTYRVTAIGCGIAGYTDDQIAPMFRLCHRSDNVRLPEQWHSYIFGSVIRSRISFPNPNPNQGALEP